MTILIRCLVAFILLAATFNPTQFNYVRWATDNWDAKLPIVVLSGLVLLIGYIVYLRATFRSIGVVGIVLIAALIGALIWVLIDFGILTLDNPGLNVWIGLVALALIMGIGLSWSIIRRRLTGQADVDDIDD